MLSGRPKCSPSAHVGQIGPIGAMDWPTRGSVRFAGRNLGDVPQGELTRFRREVIGFVFQTFNLIPNGTARSPGAEAGKQAARSEAG